MASGPRDATGRPLQARFRYGSGTPIPWPRRAPRLAGSFYKRHATTPRGAVTSCRSAVSGSLSLPSPGFFSPFPHGTRSLSVAPGYLALDRGRPGFGQGSSCPALLRYRAMETGPLRVRGSHALRRAFPCPSAAPRFSNNSTGHPRAALQPRPKAVWAPPPSLAATGGISVDFLSRATQMVHFARYGPAALSRSRARCAPPGARVTPFGHPRITGRVPLPAAYRSLPRPSSPPGS